MSAIASAASGCAEEANMARELLIYGRECLPGSLQQNPGMSDALVAL
jgi:hypothetical protein